MGHPYAPCDPLSEAMHRARRLSAWLAAGCVVGAVLAGLGGHVGAAATPFSPNVLVTHGTSLYPQHVEPSLAVDADGAPYLAWKEALTPDGPGQRVAFARSDDGGRTWSASALKALTAEDRLQSDPWLTLDETGGLHFASLEYTADGIVGGITVTSSDDGGRTWSALANADDRPGFADKESMASDGNGTLYLAYDNVLGTTLDQGDQVDLRITRSTDGGAMWSPTVPVPDAIGNVLGPVLAALPDGTVHAAWWNLTDGNVMADTSRDHGATWGADVRVNPVPGSAAAVNGSWVGSMPSIAVDGLGRLYVAWADRGTGNADVLVARSEDRGAGWTAPVRVNDDLAGEQWMPSLSVDVKGALHMAWMDGRTGAWNVEYANSTDGGRHWGTNLRVTTAETPLSFVRPGDYLGLATDANGTAYVAWTDGRGGSLEIYFARSTPASLPADGSLPWAVVAVGVLAGALVAAVLAYVVVRRRRPSGKGP